MMNNVMAVAKMISAICLALIFAALVPVSIRLNNASKQLLECESNGACLQSQLLATTGSVKAVAGAFAKAAPEIAKSVKAASANSVRASEETARTAQQATRVLVVAEGALNEFRDSAHMVTSIIGDLRPEIDNMMKSANATTKDAGLALRTLTELEQTLKAQLESGAPEAVGTLKAMKALVEDPNITKTLANVQDGTLHASSIVKTVDIATLDFRKKVARLKWALDRALSFIKVTLPIF